MVPYDWLNLESTKLRRVKYLPNAYDLRGDVLVEFNDGHMYRYKDVQQHKVERLVHSSSPGEYFYGEIRGQHEAEKHIEVQE